MRRTGAEAGGALTIDQTFKTDGRSKIAHASKSLHAASIAGIPDEDGLSRLTAIVVVSRAAVS
jgi:hypothetical protein